MHLVAIVIAPLEVEHQICPAAKMPQFCEPELAALYEI